MGKTTNAAGVKEAANRARRGEGPTFIECLTYRTRGHWEGETQDLRPSSEKELWKKRDSIDRYKRALLAASISTQQQLDDLYNQLVHEIADAVRFAEESHFPDPQEATTDVTVIK